MDKKWMVGSGWWEKLCYKHDHPPTHHFLCNSDWFSRCVTFMRSGNDHSLLLTPNHPPPPIDLFVRRRLLNLSDAGDDNNQRESIIITTTTTIFSMSMSPVHLTTLDALCRNWRQFNWINSGKEVIRNHMKNKDPVIESAKSMGGGFLLLVILIIFLLLSS